MSRRVALVHDWLTGMRGGEKVLEVFAELFPEAPIYTLFHFRGSVSERLESHPIRTSFLQRAPGVRRHYRRYLPFFPAAIEDFDFSPFDLVLSTSHCVAKGIVPGPGTRHICYCHTPMRYAWDQEHAYFPKRRGLVARIRGQILSRLRTWDAASSARVDDFIANSRFVAERIHRYYGREAEVIAPPVDVEYFCLDDGNHNGQPETPEDEGGFLLSVAALAPYKLHDQAIAACNRAGEQLIIVGDGPDRRRLERLAGPSVRMTGYVEGDRLRDYYRKARAFVQPGVEDFGIAAAEALGCGTPVIAAGAGGVLDIVRDQEHGVLYDPRGGTDALSAAIDKIGNLGFNKLNLRSQAETFSRDRFVARVKASLRSKVPELELAPARTPSS